MLEFLLQRSTVISFAVIGGVLSLIVSWLSARGSLPGPVINILNKAAYLFMGISMILFVAAGLTRSQEG